MCYVGAFTKCAPWRERLGFLPARIGLSDSCPMHDLGRLPDEGGILTGFDCRMGSRDESQRLTEGVDAMERSRIFGLADNQQVIFVAEDVEHLDHMTAESFDPPGQVFPFGLVETSPWLAADAARTWPKLDEGDKANHQGRSST